MIWNRVNWYARKHGITNDEVKNDIKIEADILFCRAVETFNPSRGSFSTHLYTRLTGHLPKAMTTKRHMSALSIIQATELLGDSKIPYDELFVMTNETSTILIEANKELTETTCALLEYIIKIARDGIGKVIPPYSKTIKKAFEQDFGIFQWEIQTSWKELSQWFRSKRQFVSTVEHNISHV
jgi:hypothetical protein